MKYHLLMLVLLIAKPSFSQNVQNSAHENNAKQVHAEPSRALVPLVKGRREFSLWAGFSFNSPSGYYLGITGDREFFIAGIRFGTIVAANRNVALEYVFDLIPAAVVTNNPIHQVDGAPLSNGENQPVHRGSVYGAGLAPIGLQLYMWPRNRLRLFFGGTGGFLSFLKDVPVLDARKFNFAFDLGLGVQMITRSNLAVTFGYKLHHLSNANTADSNPGLDANIFYLGVAAFR
ncbi:MAG: acyloxyacyl hydrolase [bacterium]